MKTRSASLALHFGVVNVHFFDFGPTVFDNRKPPVSHVLMNTLVLGAALSEPAIMYIARCVGSPFWAPLVEHCSEPASPLRYSRYG